MTADAMVASNPALLDDPTVVVTRVSKFFGQKVAVSDLSCHFGPGVTGLLGPNGAGKTTLLRMIVGLAAPSDGSIEVLGQRPRQHPAIYKDMALVPEEGAVYGHLSARQLVRYAADLSGVKDAADRVQQAISSVELDDAADRLVSGFSKGMRQRAKLAAALVTEPTIVVLDEPLNGTDPVQRARLIEIFQRLGAEGRTVIVSSHVLKEVERMTDRVIAVVDGKLAAAGDIRSIRSAMADIPFHVVVEADKPRELASALMQFEGVQGLHLDGHKINIETADLASLGLRLPSIAQELDCRLMAFKPQDDSLESVFRYLVRGR